MKSHESRLLFVYSSLRKGFHEGAYRYITQYFSFVSNAKVRGILSDLGSEPVATPCETDSFIKGELYTLNNENEFSYAFGQLDEYEGVIAEAGEHPLYRRELATAYEDSGITAPTWIYWYNKDASHVPVIPSGDVLEYLASKNK